MGALRHDLTPKKRARFLALLADGYTVSHAAGAIGITRQHLYERREVDADLRQAWDQAIEAGADVLEDEARRRAVEGVEEPIYFRKEYVGSTTRYSDTLLIFLLKARRPERFRDNVKLSGNVTVEDGLTDDQRAARLATLVALARQRADTDAGGTGDPAPVPDAE